MTVQDAKKLLAMRERKTGWAGDLFIETFDDAEDIVDVVLEWLEALVISAELSGDKMLNAIDNAIDTCDKLKSQLNDLYNNEEYW